MRLLPVPLSTEQLAALCRRWDLRELSLFGSVLRPDFRADSDVDVLVSFAEGHRMTLDSYLELRDELSRLFGGREIDLVEKRLLKNPYRRHEILRTREVVYAA